MSFANVGPWAPSAELTRAQISKIDENISNALDKTGDTITSAQTFAGTSAVTTASGSTWTLGALTLTAGATIPSGGELRSTATGTPATWALAGTHTIAGAQTWHAASLTTLTTTLTVSGAAKKIATASSGRIEMGASEYPRLASAHTGATQKRKFMLFACNVGQWGNTTWAGGTAIAQPGTTGIIVNTPGSTLDTTAPRIYLHHLATLFAVRVFWTPAGGHAALPVFPKVKLLRSRIAGGFAAPYGGLLSSDYHSDSETVLATYNNGNVRSFGIDMSRPDLATWAQVDVDTYCYSIEIVDESGANAVTGSVYHCVELEYQGIPDMRFQ